MDLPAVQLLCMEQEQEQQSLETHTSGFLDLACLINFLDESLSVFYHSSLNAEMQAYLLCQSLPQTEELSLQRETSRSQRKGLCLTLLQSLSLNIV